MFNRTILTKVAYTAMLVLAPAVVSAELKVFTCEPEWSSLAQEIGGDLVTTNSATHALQDPHYIQARPSLISKLRLADLVICSGAQLEIGWLPMLMRKGNNRAVLPGSEGFIEASMLVRRLDVASNPDRSRGDMHPQGNPHIQTNPHNILLVAEELAVRMARLDNKNAEVYDSGLQNFKTRWIRAIGAWEERAASLRGKRVITHHKSWVYLQNWLGLEEVATLEPVPGIPPSASHLGSLLERFSDGDAADLIIRAQYQSDKPSNWLSDRTGIPAIMLPLTVGGSEAATDLFKLFDDILDRLLLNPE